MGLALAHAILWVAGIYVAIGVIVGLPFAVSGIGRVDPAAKAAPWSFRVLVLPGVVALWPLIARRWLASRRTP